MTIEAHLETLERKHGELEEELRHELGRPSAHDQQISDLKRRKLRLKDEISRLKTVATQH